MLVCVRIYIFTYRERCNYVYMPVYIVICMYIYNTYLYIRICTFVCIDLCVCVRACKC